MATDPPAPVSKLRSSASGKGKGSTKKAKDAKSSPPPLKVVIRRLPHQMTEEEITNALATAASEAGMGERGGSWDLAYITPGKLSKKRGRVTGTAYLSITRGRGVSSDLALIKLQAAVSASETFAGAAKEDKMGGKNIPTGPAVAAAPFQKLFKQKPKRDVRVGTIEKDADYKAFCAALASQAPPLPSADVQADIRDSEGKEDPKPQNALLAFLKERGAKKLRDSQRVASLGPSARGSRRSAAASGVVGGGGGTTKSGSAAEASGTTGSSAAAGTSKSAAKAGAVKRTKATGLSSTSAAGTGATRDSSERDAPAAQTRGGGGGSSSTSGIGGASARSARASQAAAHPPPPPNTQQKSSEMTSSTAASTKSKGISGGSKRGSGTGKPRTASKSAGGNSKSR